MVKQASYIKAWLLWITWNLVKDVLVHYSLVTEECKHFLSVFCNLTCKEATVTYFLTTSLLLKHLLFGIDSSYTAAIEVPVPHQSQDRPGTSKQIESSCINLNVFSVLYTCRQVSYDNFSCSHTKPPSIPPQWVTVQYVRFQTLKQRFLSFLIPQMHVFYKLLDTYIHCVPDLDQCYHDIVWVLFLYCSIIDCSTAKAFSATCGDYWICRYFSRWSQARAIQFKAVNVTYYYKECQVVFNLNCSFYC